MIFKDGKTFSSYVRSKLHSGYITLSLNSPNFFAGNPLHDVYCCTKSKPMDESGIWSILTDTLLYVKAEVDSSVTYSFDQKRFQNSKSKYFDEKSNDFSN